MKQEDDVDFLLNFLLVQLMIDYIIYLTVLTKEKNELCYNWKDKKKFHVTKKKFNLESFF